MNINKQRTLEANRRYYKNNPWAGRLRAMRYRCNNKNDARYRNYGGRGIKCFLLMEDMKCLWFRDKAYLMKKPSIDRINNDGHYIFENCRFIELKENIQRQFGEFGSRSPESFAKDNASKRIPIKQYTLGGKFIKNWISLGEAARFLNTSTSNINNCLRNRSNHAVGFKWKYAEKIK